MAGTIVVLDAPETRWVVPAKIADLKAVLDAAGIVRATLFGSSDGGRQALAFAHQHPDRVQGVCVVGGSFGAFPDATPDEAAARRVMEEMFRGRELALHEHGRPRRRRHQSFLRTALDGQWPA